MDLIDLAPLAEGMFLTAGMADWAQTRQISRDPHRHEEANPFLGPHPSQERVDRYMPMTGLAQMGVYSALPDEFKLPWALATAAGEIAAVSHNRRAGLDLRPGAMAAGAVLAVLLGMSGEGKKKEGVHDIARGLYGGRVNAQPAMIDGVPGGMINFRW